MKTEEFKFNDSIINFEIDSKNVMVNATQMANIFGKKPDDFLKTEQTEAFINECCKDENYYELLGLKKENPDADSPPGKEFQVENIRLENRKKQFLKVVYGGKNNGTWMHRVLSVKMVCLPLKFVFGWLFSINENRVKPEVKEHVLKYKIECYNALFNHFFGTA
jgi:hypothetical protein